MGFERPTGWPGDWTGKTWETREGRREKPRRLTEEELFHAYHALPDKASFCAAIGITEDQGWQCRRAGVVTQLLRRAGLARYTGKRAAPWVRT